MKSPSSNQSPTPDIIAVMGKLLSDQALRATFRRSPRKVARQLGLVGAELEFVAQLDPIGLENQAETLLRKRWHEVAKLLPITIGHLGPQADEVFRYFASQSWPEGHRRHALDAANFIAFIEHNQLVNVDSTEKRQIREFA